MIRKECNFDIHLFSLIAIMVLVIVHHLTLESESNCVASPFFKTSKRC